MKKLAQLLSVLVISAFAAAAAAAQNGPGTLDTSFGTGGKLVTPIGTGADVIEDLAIQPDGKIVAVGSAVVGGTRMLVARYNADGTFDTTFDGDGWLALAFSASGSQNLYAVALQPDGKIIAVGRAGLGTGLPSAYAIIRLNPDGSLDSSFGAGGRVATQFEGGNSQARAIFIQPDGKFVVTGDSYQNFDTNTLIGRRSVARYNADGSLDAAFDGDGKVVLDLGPGNDPGFGVAVQPDGKVISAGTRSPSTAILDEDFALVRFNADGSLDASFDGDGIFTAEFEPGAWDRCLGVVVQPDGKILAGGLSLFGGTTRGALLRLNADGSFDTSFGGGDGKADTTFTGSGGSFSDLALLPNGKIVGGGSATNGSNADFAAARFNADGTLDAGFGTGGTVVTPIGTALDQAYAVKVAPNGKIVLGGETRLPNFSIGDIALVRLNGDARRDAPADFDGDGKTDFSIVRSAGPFTPYTWWTRLSGSNEVTVTTWGLRGADAPVPADYDGDGKDDIAVFRGRPSSAGATDAGNWYIIQSATNTIRIENFGLAGDTATIVDDYDGDGKDDLAVFRANAAAQGPGQAYFYYRGSLNNPEGRITYVPWGMRYGTQSTQVDDPYTGDFDGDGRADFAVQRRVDTAQTGSDVPSVFYILTASGNVSVQYFGWMSDRLVPGDYDGDGRTDLALARGFNVGTNPATPIRWFIRYSSGRADETVSFGAGINFNFAQGDYDGDGTTDIAMLAQDETSDQMNFWVRPSASPAQTLVYPWGQTGDLPAAGYNNR